MSNYIKKEERLMILGFLHAIEGVKYYEDFVRRYSLKLFNGFLDDFFNRGRYKYYPRFKYRDKRMYLPDGTLNPNRFRSYWRLF